MNFFYVFKKNQDEFLFIKEGFSLKALIFGPIWLLCNKIWLISSIIIALYILIYTLSSMQILTGNMAILAYIAINIYLGFNGEYHLINEQQKKLDLMSIISAKNQNIAQSKYFGDVYFFKKNQTDNEIV